jgi:hypothetical protein
MILFGVVWIIICARLPDREPWVYSGEAARENNKTPEEKASERNRRRKQRRKLR